MGDGTNASLSSPAAFSFLVPAYCHKYGVDPDEMGSVLNRIAWKNHQNGAVNPGPVPKGSLAREDRRLAPGGRPTRGVRLQRGQRRGGGGADSRAEDAHKYTDSPLYVKGLSLVAGPAAGAIDPEYDYTTFEEVVRSAADAYQQAGVTDPRSQLAMAEVHDCFTPTELVLRRGSGLRRAGYGVERGHGRDLRP